MMRSVSLFSGCGGLDLGLLRAGFKPVFANDTEPLCRSSYVANFRDECFHLGSASDIDLGVLREVSRGQVEKGVDLLAGGPPCPPFSKSRFYRTEKPRGLADPSGSATLGAYLRVLSLVQPRAFLFENVPGFAYKVHRAAFELLADTATKLGYQITCRVVNAADYGVPQVRERFIMVGMKSGQFKFPEPTHAVARSGAGSTWVTSGAVLNDLDTAANASDEGHRAGGKHRELLSKIPPGENYLFFTKERGHPRPLFRWRSRYWSFLLKLSPDRPSWTIQARRSNNMGPLHWRNRILRIAEVKRLQTFPDDWELAGTIEQQWRQIGNAVPPLLAEVIGTAIRKQLGPAARQTSGARTRTREVREQEGPRRARQGGRVPELSR
jgi:DNA (cytosine-5)-methyltransferase 1